MRLKQFILAGLPPRPLAVKPFFKPQAAIGATMIGGPTGGTTGFQGVTFSKQGQRRQEVYI